MIDYGIDLLLTNDDIVFTADGDVEVVSGAATVAQDIDQTLKIASGSLYWDAQIGSSLPLMLNDSQSNDDAIIIELERVAIADARVKPESVKAYRIANGKFRLEFTPLKAIKPETLDFDLIKRRET
jgi:phage baseplate assembly protein W